MDGAKKNPVANAATGVVEGPYTGLGNGEERIVSSAEMTAIRALDRKLTDGLNLVHGQFAAMRTERQEDREEFREFRRQHREDTRELKRELKAEIARVDARAEQRTKELEGRLNERLAEVDARAEQRTKDSEARMDQRSAEVDARFNRLENALLKLTAQMNKSLERSSGTRRLVWGVLGAVALLLTGGLIRPLFERAVVALLGG